MTAVPLSEAEAATVQRFEAAPYPDEVLREKVARALDEAEAAHRGSGFPCPCGWVAGFGQGWEGRLERHRSLAAADAALAAIRGASDE